jgi:hypothetical protein
MEVKLYTPKERPDLIFSNKLPGIDNYSCLSNGVLSCGCNQLYAWSPDDKCNRYNTYCMGNFRRKVKHVDYKRTPAETHSEEQYRVMKNLFMRLLLGIVYNDLEARPKDEIINYIGKITEDVGAPFNADRIFSKMVEDNLLIFAQEKDGMGFFTHNLPKTLAHDYKRDRQGIT